jgi:SAM-dependent methyltransferase
MTDSPPEPPAGTPHRAVKARFWDRLARRYAGAAISDPAGYARSLQRTREWLAPDRSVLEIGCGTGALAQTLSLGTGPYLGLDISPRMVALANARLAASPRPNLRFLVDDADAPGSGPAGPFDVVIAFNVLHLLDSLDDGLARCARWLRPGGVLVAKTPCLGELGPLWSRGLIPLLTGLRLVPPVQRLREADLVAACQRQGLEVLAVERHASGGRDVRPFLVARKPAMVPAMPAATAPSGAAHTARQGRGPQC